METIESGPLIVLVEDMDAIRELLTEFLQKNGYRVRAFADTTTAAAAWPELQQDAVLLISDLMAGADNGMVLLTHLRGKDPRLPAILISGSGTPSQPLPAGCEFLEKPFGLRKLLDVVHRIIAER